MKRPGNEKRRKGMMVRGAFFAAVLMTAAVIPAAAGYGPGMKIPYGPGGGKNPNPNTDTIYVYPGLKGAGPNFFAVINTFSEESWDEDTDEWMGYTQGWRHSPEGWWYLKADGSWLNDGWECIDGRWYYFEESGHAKTGWFEENGARFYLNPVDDGTYGAMRTGWQIIDGKAYYFNASSDGTLGALLRNTTTPDGYQVGADGAAVLP